MSAEVGVAPPTGLATNSRRRPPIGDATRRRRPRRGCQRDHCRPWTGADSDRHGSGRDEHDRCHEQPETRLTHPRVSSGDRRVRDSPESIDEARRSGRQPPAMERLPQSSLEVVAHRPASRPSGARASWSLSRARWSLISPSRAATPAALPSASSREVCPEAQDDDDPLIRAQADETGEQRVALDDSANGSRPAGSIPTSTGMHGTNFRRRS